VDRFRSCRYSSSEAGGVASEQAGPALAQVETRQSARKGKPAATCALKCVAPAY
jgi:hypothetical protein